MKVKLDFYALNERSEFIKIFDKLFNFLNQKHF